MNRKTLREIRPGILNKEQVIKLKANFINGLKVRDLDQSAFDLHLSQQGWQMKGGIKGSSDKSVMEIVQQHKKRSLTIEQPVILKARKTYVFQLEESLNLPQDHEFYGRATGKSSIGRLDVLARLMVDRCPSYDEINPKHDPYPGTLFLELTPITFDVKVQHGVSLSQLRLFRGAPELSELKEKELGLFGDMILDENREPKKDNVHDLRVDLTPDPRKGISAFQAKNGKDLVVDLTTGKNSNDPKRFWKDIRLKGDLALKIVPERFYILRSKERFKLPLDIAVYCEAVSETLGELRIHYAGFVHPGFGYRRREGTPIIFEVRGHNVRTFLRDGETLAHIKFYKMSRPCPESSLKKKRSDYEDQELALSSYFKDWN